MGWAAISVLVLSGLFLSFIFYGDIQFVALMCTIGAVVVGELIVHFRWRFALICPYCGFDPVTYKKSPHQAALRVKEHMEFRKNSPRALLSRPVLLPRIMRTAEVDKEAKGQNLSRVVG